MRDTWVGYPVQANVWRLPEKEVQTILTDLAKKDGTPRARRRATSRSSSSKSLGRR